MVLGFITASICPLAFSIRLLEGDQIKQTIRAHTIMMYSPPFKGVIYI